MENKKLAIIFIDDDKESANSIILHLKKDFNIQHFLTAKEGLKALKENTRAYDLILVDYDLVKEKNGIEVLREIRRNIIYHIPAIMISAVVNSMQQIEDATNAGFAKYFRKYDPHLPEKLKAAIIELTAQKNDAADALDKWIKEKLGRETEVVSEWNGKSYTAMDILEMIRNSSADPDQRMRLVRTTIEFLLGEKMREYQK